MRATSVLVLVISIGSWAAPAAATDPAELWRPIHPFIGAWKGSRAGERGSTVTRVYASAATNHHVEITEANGGRSRAAVWGMVSLDPQQETLVLRQFAADGSALELTLDATSSAAGQLVFTSPESDAMRLRITCVRSGPNQFVERIERASGGAEFVLVSETRFVRRD